MPAYLVVGWAAGRREGGAKGDALPSSPALLPSPLVAVPLPDLTTIRRTLAELSDADIDRLVVFALECPDASCSSWSEAADKYGLRRSETRALSGKDLEPLRDRLLDAGILVPSYGESRFRLLGPVVLEVLSLGNTRGRLAGLAETYHRRHERGRISTASAMRSRRGRAMSSS